MSRLRDFLRSRPADSAAGHDRPRRHRRATRQDRRALRAVAGRRADLQPGAQPRSGAGRLSRRHRPHRRTRRASAPWTWSASRRTIRIARRCARSSSTSISTRKTKSASSSPARACSRCTWATRSTRSCARQGDLIGVPDSTTHWFDMGPEPHFIAIRFFTEPDGWVGHFTGSDLAQRFPRFEAAPRATATGEAAPSSPTSKAPPAPSPSSRTCCSPTRDGPCPPSCARTAASRKCATGSTRSAADAGGVCQDDVLVEVLQGWIDEDRKHPALKALQGMIWAEGYASGELRAHIYADAVRRACGDWHARGHPHLRVFVGLGRRAETVVRPQHGRRPEALVRRLLRYRRRRQARGRQLPHGARRTRPARGRDVLFLSDVVEELDAAREAGMADGAGRPPRGLSDAAPGRSLPRPHAGRRSFPTIEP